MCFLVILPDCISVATNGCCWFGRGSEDLCELSDGPFKRARGHLHPSNPPFFSFTLRHQAAADFAKAHLPEALRQQLLSYEREKVREREKDKEKEEKRERATLSYPSILEQQILTVDREMLDKLSATYNEAGLCF